MLETQCFGLRMVFCVGNLGLIEGGLGEGVGVAGGRGGVSGKGKTSYSVLGEGFGN